MGWWELGSSIPIGARRSTQRCVFQSWHLASWSWRGMFFWIHWAAHSQIIAMAAFNENRHNFYVFSLKTCTTHSELCRGSPGILETLPHCKVEAHFSISHDNCFYLMRLFTYLQEHFGILQEKYDMADGFTKSCTVNYQKVITILPMGIIFKRRICLGRSISF